MDERLTFQMKLRRDYIYIVKALNLKVYKGESKT